MPIDIRANVTCSLGTLISASVNDDYVQGSGLIKTRGSCEISGLVSPAVGSVVTFNYTKSGVTRSVPRKLRVLSSFADPFRRTTKLELGCKLTYLANLRDKISWKALDDPENAELTEDDAKIITVPIWASSVMRKCLTELGLSATQVPLTNQFSIAEFDFSSGYVSILSDLLVSESYCGYLDYTERLVVFPLSVEGGGGPSLSTGQIIDIGSIGVGDLPGDAVTVSYSTLKLKLPDETELATEDQDANSEGSRERRWEYQRSTSGPNTYTIAYQSGNATVNAVYTGTETTEVETQYTTIAGNDLPTVQTTTLTGSSAKIGGSIASQYLKNGIGFNAVTLLLERSITTYTYTPAGNRLREETINYRQALQIFGALNLPYVQSSSDFVSFGYTLLPAERSVRTFDISGSVSLETVTNYNLWPFSLTGQQTAAESGLDLTTTGDVSTYVNALATSGFGYSSSSVQLNATPAPVGRPNDVINSAFAEDTGDPDNGYRTESSSELELAWGSPTAQLRIEFSLPYAPDDTFYKAGGKYYSRKSDAEQKANLYGRVQNKMLLGNRNGLNVQTVPEILPGEPFAPFYLTANGVVTQYRTNGTSWTMDSNGIVASTDALYWGVVGRTA
jgi:hypothetical protein